MALGRITNKLAGEGPITSQDVRDLELTSRALMNVYKLGRKQAAAVSPVPYLLKAHDLRADEKEVMIGKENRCPTKVTEEIWKLRCPLSPFLKKEVTGCWQCYFSRKSSSAAQIGKGYNSLNKAV